MADRRAGSVQFCLANGEQYPLDRPFSYDQDCYRFNCKCELDGSWECPPDHTESICDDDGKVISGSRRTSSSSTRVETSQSYSSRTSSGDRSVVSSTGLGPQFCLARGKQYFLDRPFSFEENCFRFNCFCQKDGSWECPSEDTERICGKTGGSESTRVSSTRVETSSRTGTGTRDRIAGSNTGQGPQHCVVVGTQYTLDRPFSFDDGCYRFRCFCQRDGSWKCPAKDTENVCGGREKVSRSGRTSVSSTRVETSYRIRTGTGHRTAVSNTGQGPRFCLVDDSKYALNQSFGFDQDCFRFTCMCNSDGSWECPAKDTENLCGGPLKASRSGSTSVTSTRVETAMPIRPGTRETAGQVPQFCLVVGTQYSLDRPFSFSDGCYRFRCFCQRDGSWECPARDTENLCGGREKISRSGRTTVSSTRLETGYHVKTGTDDRTAETYPSDGPQFCLVVGQRYSLDRSFSFDDGCYRFHCFCQRDGSWECLARDTENLCGGREKVSRAGRTTVSSTRVETGSRVNTGSTGDRTAETSPTEEVQFCLVVGTQYTLDRPFSFDDGCYRFRCFCQRDGSWVCPARDTENLCGGREKISRSGRTSVSSTRVETSYRVRTRTGDKTAEPYPRNGPQFCLVVGQRYSLHRPFSFDDGCYRFRCFCQRDGSWECPARDTENVCGGREKVGRSGRTTVSSTRVETGSRVSTGDRKVDSTSPDGLKYCSVYGEQYTLNEPFTFDQDCYRFNCFCKRDGGWECPAGDTEILCGDREKISRSSSRTETSTRVETGSRIKTGDDDPSSTGFEEAEYCLVEEQEYPLNRDFIFDDECYRFKCFCYRDGSWNCPAADTLNICGGTVRIGKSGRTMVSSTRVEHGRTERIRTGTDDTSGGVGPIQTATFCLVDGTEYQLNREFGFDQECFRYKCFCSQDGSWNCPAESTKNLCGRRDKRGRSGRTYYRRTGTTDIPVPGSGGENRPGVRFCEVNRQRFRLNSRFTYRRGCTKFNCICRANGSYSCPASETEDLCAGDRKQPAARYCEVDGEKYRLNSHFTYRRRCTKFNCVCNLDGSTDCPASRTENICEDKAPGSIPKDLTPLPVEGNPMAVTLNWQPPQRPNGQITGYLVFYTTDSRQAEEDWVVQGVQGDDPSTTIKDLSSATTYFFKVQARNNKGYGPMSPTITYSTPREYCQVEGQNYRLSSRFSYEKGCTKFNCICRADGTHDCPTRNREDICGTEGQERLGYCRVGGQYFRKHSSFTYTEGCKRYRDCTCHGDGTYNCPRATENICETAPTPRPKRIFCLVERKYYRPKTRFTYTKDCFKYSCVCRADGSHECPPVDVERVCENPNPAPTARPNTSDRAGYCRVEGQYYPYASRFSYTKECFKYNCHCTAKGRVDCPKSQAVEVCEVTPRPQPEPCVVDGRYHRLNSRFSYVRDCVKYNCVCRLDGSHDCPDLDRENACPQQTPEPGPEHCFVEGEYQRLNSRFSYVKGCVKYNCVCRHDGSHDCPSSDSENACPVKAPEHCIVEKQHYRLNSRFSYRQACKKFNCVCRTDGSVDCPRDDIEDLCPKTPSPYESHCFVNGQYYPPNTRFAYDRGCTRYECTCRADGTPNCPDSRKVDLCAKPTSSPEPPGCRNCAVEGRNVPSGGSFTYRRDCYQYGCDCKCDGTWHCPGDRTKYICDAPEGSDDDECISCRVKGRTYNGDSDFQIREGCYELNCRCRCDGTWDCPPDKATNVCPTLVPTTRDPNIGVCKYCIVRGLKYKPDSAFSYYEGCYEFNCQCDCDGSWECPAENTKDICNVGGDDTCRDCMVRSQTYKANTQFELQRGCSAFDCTCYCNGTYKCPASSKRDVCNDIDEPNGSSCKRCIVKEDTYRPNTRFNFIEACFEYDCDCECDGSWHCPESRTKMICKGPINESHVIPRPSCGVCKIGLNTYKGNTRFKHTQECFEFICDCNCGGSWDCDPDQTKNLCEDGIPADSARLVDVETCRTCVVTGITFPSQKPFTYQRECLERDCFCHCDGTNTCPSEKSVCDMDDKDTNGIVLQNGQNDKGGCRVNDVLYTTPMFSFDQGCLRYNCVCDQGSYICPAKQTVQLC